MNLVARVFGLAKPFSIAYAAMNAYVRSEERDIKFSIAYAAMNATRG